LFRDGKATFSREVNEILQRLGTPAEAWQARLQKLSKGWLFGRFLSSFGGSATSVIFDFAASRQRLREVAERLRLKRVPNLGGCPASPFAGGEA
jgi:hypothetical protein